MDDCGGSGLLDDRGDPARRISVIQHQRGSPGGQAGENSHRQLRVGTQPDTDCAVARDYCGDAVRQIEGAPAKLVAGELTRSIDECRRRGIVPCPGVEPLKYRALRQAWRRRLEGDVMRAIAIERHAGRPLPRVTGWCNGAVHHHRLRHWLGPAAARCDGRRSSDFACRRGLEQLAPVPPRQGEGR